MRPHKPIITTTQNGEAVEFTARYESPAWANIIAGIEHVLWSVLFLLLWFVGSYWVTVKQPFGLTQGQAVVIALGWVAGAWKVANIIAKVLAEFRFGLLPGGDRRLRLTLSRESVRVNSGTVKGIYARGPVLRFTAQPHLQGKFEARHAERTSQLGPHFHRDAFQVWLQHGNRVIELAAASSEDEANAIVRQLQAADEQASRGVTDAETFANRPRPE
jgi:hypothetical protein